MCITVLILLVHSFIQELAQFAMNIIMTVEEILSQFLKRRPGTVNVLFCSFKAKGGLA